MNTSCASYVPGDTTKCIQCYPETGILAEGCKIPIENCDTYDNFAQHCKSCEDGFLRSAAGNCIKYHGTSGCVTPYS